MVFTVQIRCTYGACIVYVGCKTAETAAVFEMLGRAEPLARPVTMLALVGGIEYARVTWSHACESEQPCWEWPVIGLESHTSDKEDDAMLPKKARMMEEQ